MRRHWRNHVSNSRRRDSVARQIETDLPAQMPPTPPLSASAASSPRSHYENSLSSSLASSSGAHNSRLPSPECSASEGEDGDMEMDSRDSDVTVTQALHTVSTLSIKAETAWDMSVSAWNTAASGPRHDKWRQRSRSSPVPRYREVQPESSHPISATGVSRTRSSSCSVPGCDCQPVISTTLRPAFPSSSIRSSAGQSN
ncbi:hypothetical protein PHLCEN_2v1521 [Hermanssonia centrifuga]|uniref:Uncharacterized protein n=1 Tax=Hermanssonia centrifuga TaxID=98765 RepID=A0A2R6RZV2_9APHY|nr:hypothetical protein PHLCEN_2v1521 [Hermanssonia centrifuga]